MLTLSLQGSMLACGLMYIHDISVKVSSDTPLFLNLFEGRYFIKDWMYEYLLELY